jgi:hypothetical protein
MTTRHHHSSPPMLHSKSPTNLNNTTHQPPHHHFANHDFTHTIGAAQRPNISRLVPYPTRRSCCPTGRTRRKSNGSNYPDFVGSIATAWKRLRNCASSLDRSYECMFSVLFFVDVLHPESFRSELPLFSLF